MNRYEITLRGNRIQMQASSARIALNRTLKRLTDSQFLNTTITIKFKGKAHSKTPETWDRWIVKPQYPEGRP